MNWLDIVLIILSGAFFVGALFCLVLTFIEGDLEFLGGVFVLVFVGVLILIPMWAFDWQSGITTGKITSVDKNLWGTTALYIKTSETEQEKYCIENKSLLKEANSLIGKEVTITYGKRFGIYSVKKCHQSPIEKIETIE